MEGLTARQEQVLAYLREHIAREQRPPSLRELAAHFGWKSLSGTRAYLNALEAEGFIARAGGHIHVLGMHLQWVVDQGSRPIGGRLAPVTLIDDPLKSAPAVRHRPGCGVAARGCVEGCPNFDPRFDS